MLGVGQNQCKKALLSLIVQLPVNNLPYNIIKKANDI